MVPKYGHRPVVIGVGRKFRQNDFRPIPRVNLSGPTAEMEPPAVATASNLPVARHDLPTFKKSAWRPFLWVMENLLPKLSKVFLGIGMCSSPLYIIPFYLGDYKSSAVTFLFATAVLGAGLVLEAKKTVD